ncbi:hypothetical protein BaRGS_00013542 [Batillaria attramentaria]|uniref:Uncharacterized protein n=1 Tax=Batillaria attramentaria TaxID=370345 RepID=A0ABD0L7I2_9CAEN
MESGVNVTDWRASRFNMSYTTYPKHTLPPELEVGVYNCSPPYIVPQELQCDGIAQCLDGETSWTTTAATHILAVTRDGSPGNLSVSSSSFPQHPSRRTKRKSSAGNHTTLTWVLSRTLVYGDWQHA